MVVAIYKAWVMGLLRFDRYVFGFTDLPLDISLELSRVFVLISVVILQIRDWDVLKLLDHDGFLSKQRNNRDWGILDGVN